MIYIILAIPMVFDLSPRVIFATRDKNAADIKCQRLLAYSRDDIYYYTTCEIELS